MAAVVSWSYFLFFLGAVAIWILTNTVRDYLLLKQFNGPPIAAFTRFWLLRANIAGQLNHHFQAVNNKYGKTARVGPRFLLTSDPALVRKMNAVRSSYRRGTWYHALRLHPTRDNVVSYRDETIHDRLRSQMAFGYSGKENDFLEQDIEGGINAMFRLIDSKYTSSPTQYRPLDLGRISTFFAMDVISTVAFGKSLGFLDADEDPYDYLKQVHVFLPAIIFFGVFPEVQKLMRLSIMQKVLPSATDANGIGKVMGFARDAVAERFGENKIVRRDMLGSFLKHGLTQGELESETITQLAAGSDSTAGSIRMAIFLITTNLPVYHSVISELESAIASKRLTRPILRDAEARTLPYLQACIKEMFRCYPPVAGLLAKLSPPEGDYVDGKFIPPNVQIGWNPCGMMRDKEIFGEDAECFRPERWLPVGGRTSEQLARMEETVWMIFAYGRFTCLGKNVALIEINKAVPELLLRYNFQIANPSKPFDLKCVGFFVTTGMLFRVEPRTPLY